MSDQTPNLNGLAKRKKAALTTVPTGPNVKRIVKSASDFPTKLINEEATPQKEVKENERSRSRIESGIPVTLSNTTFLIQKVTTFGPRYAPSQAIYQVASLQAVSDQGYLLVDKVIVTNTANSIAIAQRSLVYDGLGPLCTRAINELILSGALPQVVEKARGFIRKMDGARAEAVKPGADSISASQTSFPEVAKHFEGFITVLEAVPTYTPVEEAIKIVSLRAKKDELLAKNLEVQVTQAEVEAARIERNHHFDTPVTGLADVFMGAKKAVKVIFGATSPEYKQVSSLVFRKIKYN